MKLQVLIILALSIIAVLPQSSALAQAGVIPVTDTWINKRYDFVLYVDIKPLPRFLNYEKSKLNPMTKIEVTYRWTQRNKNYTHPADVFQYEDLYFSKGKIYGAHRYCFLQMASYEQGCIWIRPQDTDPIQESQALASTIVHLILDIYARKTILASVIVPLQAFASIETALGVYQFFVFTMSYPGGPGQNMSVHIMSDPTKIERYFYYDDEGRR